MKKLLGVMAFFVISIVFSMINLTEAATLQNGWYKIRSENSPNRILDVYGEYTSSGTNIQLFDDKNGSHQKFYLENTGNGFFTLRAGHCNLYVSAANNSGNRGTNVVLANRNGSNGQLWRIVDAGNGAYYVESKLKQGLILNCYGGYNANETNVQLWDWENVAWSKWKFISARNTPVNDYDGKVKSFMSDSRYAAGSKWNNCYNYASAFVQYVFGKSNARDGARFTSANEIRNGDVIHVNASQGKSQHWLVVLYRNGNRLTTTEGNWTNRAVRYSDSAYYIQNGQLYSNGKPFRAWDCGYHFQ